MICKFPVKIMRRMAIINQSPWTAELFMSLDTLPSHIPVTPLKNVEVNSLDFDVSGPGEVVEPTRPAQWDPLEPRLSQRDAHKFETGLCLVEERL